MIIEKARKSTLKIGYFEHWTQPDYKFVDFLKEEGIDVSKIDYSHKFYLEGFDIALVEQNGFNDYIENDEAYIQDWVKRGGIILFMHQTYERWAPYFLPKELGYTQLIHRHVKTINGSATADTYTGDLTCYKNYLMPWIEDCGRRLFLEPEEITIDEMIDWKILIKPPFPEIKPAEYKLTRTAASCCYLLPENWEILGSYMDPAVRDGALIAKCNYGKGMYFLNQLYFPEVLTEEAKRCINFWKKYVKNLFAYMLRFINGEKEDIVIEKKTLPIKKNYKMCTHMHSLDWYGADSHPGTINAMLRYLNIDIASIAVKDNAPFKGILDVSKYSDDKVLLIDGQEYHPFNWDDKYANFSHNTYHILAIGIDANAYTTKFTCSRFGDEELKQHTQDAVDYIHKHNGVACATHPYFPFWTEHDVDASDIEPLIPLSGTHIEKYWVEGNISPIMVSVDLFGFRRILDNPAVNFIYLRGKTPNRDNICQAIRDRNIIAATGFDEADITIDEFLPGDIISKEQAKNGTLKIHAKTMAHNITKVRVYSNDTLIYEKGDFNSQTVDLSIPLKDFELNNFVRVEVEGKDKFWSCNSTPFFIR